MKSQLNYKVSDPIVSLKPSLKAGVCYFLSLILLASCSSFKIPTRSSKGGNISKQTYKEITPEDYSDHLASLKDAFLSTPGIKTFGINDQSRKYLQGLADEIIAKNEIFFKSLRSANIVILDLNSPLHFSLPKGWIFLSKALISKYIKHESMLVSILSYELVRSEKLLYPKETVVPVGYVSLEKILSLGRLGLEEKMGVHKWAHYLTVRSGYDGEYYLSWLQTQNRNTADFLLQVGDANLITREESLFKAFLIKNSNEEDLLAKKNSSKSFYTFLNSIRDEVL
ncbi:MAG TPA: hypothetical protein VNJ01_14535 [Bacteriovoracaceae bacterium]|nr:hypothetical protein [Bacteriovoracaceae bacterium]